MKSLTQANNKHLASEFQASHVYLSMSIRLSEKDLAGFSQCLRLAEDNSAALLLLDQKFLEGSALAHVKAGMAIYGGQ
jgi:ferritin